MTFFSSDKYSKSRSPVNQLDVGRGGGDLPQLLDSGVASIEESNDPGTRNNKLQRTFRIEEDSDSVKSGGPSCLGPVLQTLQTIPSQSPPDSAHTTANNSSFWETATMSLGPARQLTRGSNSFKKLTLSI